MKEIRVTKLRCALLTAIADITQNWNLDTVTSNLSRFADRAVDICVSFLITSASKNQQIDLPNKASPQEGCGLVVLALGKLGSKELNYSSDIDLVIFYDEKNNNYRGRTPISQFYVNITHELSNLLQSRTVDGYVFRTDLRLRPDPGATAVAVSISAAMHYYETVGQNWERAAMIKSRFISGDREASDKLIIFLNKYVWRKYLDFTSIEDIHSIKRQIDSKIGELPKNLYSYNIKLGHGGIREIEFFVQTQQLIWGGRETELQVSDTCKALKLLEEKKQISKKARNQMTESYRLYRHIEHRLQMVADMQTHSLPDSPEKMEEFAIFCGYENSNKLIKELTDAISKVKRHYSKLFEHSPALSSTDPGFGGSLIFTGTENHPETLKTLKRMGFKSPEVISETVRGWHHGRRRGTRTKKAREILTEIMPSLLKSFSQTINPDTAFAKFDEFLSKLPAGIQLFSLCHANPQILDLIADIMGGYPYLAGSLSRTPSLLEYVLTTEFYKKIPDEKILKEALEKRLSKIDDIEDMLNTCRIWANDRQFRVGVQMIKNKISANKACAHLSAIANVVLETLYEKIEKHFAEQHNPATGYDFAAIVMGKLGSYELTFGSDIDIVFVFRKNESIKKKETIDLSPNEYFARLGRRYIGSINSLTNEGKLYEVDTRLRPSGSDGPLVPSLESYSHYFDESAWSWELMALTRARVLFAPCDFKKKLEKIINEKLTKKQLEEKLKRKIDDIRQRVVKKHGTNNPFYIKHALGGLMDLEYIIQFLQLLHAYKKPQILTPKTSTSIHLLEKHKILSKKEAQILEESFLLYQNVQSVLRLMDSDKAQEKDMTDGMKKILAKTTNSKNFYELKKSLEKSQENVQKLYGKYLCDDN
jgi:glutamate-ammonia-ligase adenylyltransferase